MKIEDLNHEEKLNSMLVTLKNIESEPSARTQNGITPKNIEFYLGIKEEEINSLLPELINNGLVDATLDSQNNFTQCMCTENANQMFKNFESRPLNDISLIILQKSYELYQRYNYSLDLQINSVLVAHSIGIVNHEKVKSAVQNLIDHGLLRKLVITRQYISFSITLDGVNYMENSKDNSEENITTSTPIIIHGNQGNISIASNNVTQTLNRTEIERSFNELEQVIRRELSGEEQKVALENLEAASELAKLEKPKKSVISRVLDCLPQIPAIIDGVKTIIDKLPM